VTLKVMEVAAATPGTVQERAGGVTREASVHV
jgi:hypothetical protein